MITFKHFTLSAPAEWSFVQTEPIVIGKHSTSGSLLLISPAFKNDISENPGHREAIEALKFFAQLNTIDEVKAEILKDNKVKVGFFSVYKDRGTEHYFYAVKENLLTVAVLQRCQQCTHVKDQVISIMESVTYVA